MYNKLIEGMLYAIMDVKFKDNDNRLAMLTAFHLLSDMLAENITKLSKDKVIIEPYTLVEKMLCQLYEKLPFENQLSVAIYTGCSMRNNDEYISCVRKAQISDEVDRH